MDIFTVGLITLAAATVVFYIVVFSFFFYWHLKSLSYIVVPVIFTFQFFAIGFCVVAIVSIILDYLPFLIRAYGL